MGKQALASQCQIGLDYLRLLPIVVLVTAITLATPLKADIRCGNVSTVSYPGTPVLSTVISLPRDYNGISLDPPEAATDSKNGIIANYRWEHVGTFAIRSGTGSLTTHHWSGVTKNSSITAGFGVSASASVSAGGGVPGVYEVKTTLTTTFGYDSSITNSMSEYDQRGIEQEFDLQQNLAVQVWRLTIDHTATATGVAYTTGTTTTISCSYPLDFTKQLFVRILGKNYLMPLPPTVDQGNVVHHPAPQKVSLRPSTLYLLANKPRMQAEAFRYHRLDAPRGGGAPDGTQMFWSDGHSTYVTNEPYEVGWWANRFMAGPGDPYNPGFVGCGLIYQGPSHPVTGLPFYPACPNGLNSDCGDAALSAWCIEARTNCRFRHIPVASLSCPIREGNTGCRVQYGSIHGLQSMAKKICKEWSVVAAGGIPTRLCPPEDICRRKHQSSNSLRATVGWNKIRSSDAAAASTLILEHEHGITSTKEHQEYFSTSLGIETEATGSLDVVSVSSKLSITLSAHLSNTWGFAINEFDRKEFKVSFPGAAHYDAYSLTVDYFIDQQHNSTQLETLSNFVVVLDSGPKT
ncbi:MAG: hypothetical protein GY835_24810 [bacterium]|nr:hypothetical protein [bacterium]